MNAGVSPGRWGNAHPNIVPYQMFRGSDGHHFVVAVGTQALWQRLLQVLALGSELGGDARFSSNAARIQHREQLIPLLQQRFVTASTKTWLERFAGADIPAAPIQTVGEALSDSQTLSRGLIVEIDHPSLGKARSIANPVRLTDHPVLYRLPPPLLGEHNREILGEIGLSDFEIESALCTACKTGIP